MPRFVIIELQSVKAVREVEAETEEEAYDIFCNGEGTPVGKDGDVTSTQLLSITKVDD